MIETLVSENKDSIKLLVPVITLAASIVYFILYPLCFDPLAKIPGPKICALTKYWILYKSWSEQRNRYVNYLHTIYGPIVRIGPKEVDISDESYLTDVMVRDMDKSHFYSQFINYGSPNTFSTISQISHRERRKVSTRFYSKTHVCTDESQTNIKEVMSNLFQVIDKYKNKPINVFILWSDMAMDVITAFSFGSKYNKKVMSDPFGMGKRIVMDFFVQSGPGFWVTQMPQYLSLVVSKDTKIKTKKCYDWIMAQFQDSLKGLADSEQSLVNTLLGQKAQSVSKPAFDKKSTASECFDHIAAGHNTTATTLSFLYYELASHPEVQQRLIEELKDYNGGEFIASDDYHPQDYLKIENLPFMNAVIDETFRVFPAIPGQEPRVAPKKGMIWRGSQETPKCVVPGGTVITMQPWSLHRNPKVFTDPNHWNPDRWLTTDKEKLRMMHRHLIPFSAGARMCIGKNIAICEIKLNLSSILSRYRVELQDGFDYNKYSYFADIYTSIPRHAQMPIVFKPLKTGSK